MIGVFLLCSIAWIFFVSNSVSDAFYVILHLLSGIHSPIVYLKEGYLAMGMSKDDVLFTSISVMILALFDYFSLKVDVINCISAQKVAIRWLIYCAFSIWLIMNIPGSNSMEFIYFQF